eukprot:5135757-Amphidinium_carterae.1
MAVSSCHKLQEKGPTQLPPALYKRRVSWQIPKHVFRQTRINAKHAGTVVQMKGSIEVQNVVKRLDYIEPHQRQVPK